MEKLQVEDYEEIHQSTSSEEDWRIYVFGTRSLHRIMGYRWYDFVKSAIVPWDQFEAYYYSIDRQRQLQLYGHRVILKTTDPELKEHYAS